MGFVDSCCRRAFARIAPALAGFVVCTTLHAAPRSAITQRAAITHSSAAQHAVRAARSERLSTLERDTLMRGGVVSRPLRFEAQGGVYVGGVAYVIVHATPEAVLACLSDVSQWPEFLPRTRSAVLLKTEGPRAWIELTQGNAVASGKYTLGLTRSARGEEFRFWRDRSKPGDIRDVWGYFRVRPFTPGSSLVSVAAAVDLGPGLVRWLFEDAVQRIVLATPHHLRAYVEPRALARFP